MTFSAYHLTFTSPLHLSRGKDKSYESSHTRLHSDTIKSALFVSAMQLFGQAEAEKMLCGIRVSSAFPFDKTGRWLPRPMGASFKNAETADNQKDLKKAEWLTERQFSAFLNGDLPKMTDEKGQIQQPEIWQRDVTQRVKINYDSDSEPFYLEKLFPKAGCGLWFIAQSDNGEGDFSKFDAALRLLGDNGIGLQRGLGNGHFSFEKAAFDLDLPATASAWVALSLYRPTEKAEIESAIKDERSQYRFIRRGGWINSPENDEHLSLRKKAVLMFAEGSVFAFSETAGEVLAKGKIEDLKPDWNAPIHSIWRDGRAIFLPIKAF